jgi:D-glycero-D-manno-heptose 1,7-bisphosphate phosphatase
VPRPGVILDRDGTVIDFHRDTEQGVVTPAFHPKLVRFLPGAIDGLRALASKGFVLSIATNQPGAAKGELPREAIERTNAAVVERLASEGIVIERVATCLHHPTGGDGGDPALVRSCGCRKPAPGLLLELIEELDLDPARSWFVGDTPTDVQAARRAGLKTALVFRAGRCEICPLRDGPPFEEAPDLAGSSLDEIAARIAFVAGAQGE